MTAIAIELVALVALILVGGVLAMSEIAVVSARTARLRRQADEGDPGAAAALELAAAPGRFLSTVQIGITLVGILAGALGGATLASELAHAAGRVPWLAPYAEALGVGAVVLGITYLSLVLGELVPKRIGLRRAEATAALVAPAMQRLARLVHPLVRLLDASSNLVLRLLPIPLDPGAPVSDEEIQVLLRQGAESGVFEPIEQEIVDQMFRLSDRTVGSLVTPRTEIVWLDVDDPPHEVVRKLEAGRHARYPVARGGLDDVVGHAAYRDLVAPRLSGGEIDVRAALRPGLVVPDAAPALDALEQLRETRAKMALVVDEFGSLLGLVTLGDLLAEIVGDLSEPGAPAGQEAVRRPDGSWLLDGLAPLDVLEELTALTDLRARYAGHYRTVGGFAMAALGRIPRAGDRFEVAGVSLEVVDMDGRRVDKVLVTPPA